MINEFNAARSCLTRLKQYTDANSYGISVEGTTKSFGVDEIYLDESYLSNENERGLSSGSSQFQLPIYQININTPKAMGKAKGLSIYDELVSHFVIDSDISLELGQKVRIVQLNKTQLPATDTHNLTVVSVNLRLIG